MLIFWKESLVLFAVPKTGTTAIEGALAPRAAVVMRDPPEVKHTPVYRYNRFVAPYLAQVGKTDFTTVAVVRHPLDWLSSWYRYRHREDIAGHRNSTRDMTFEAFVTDYAEGTPTPPAAVGSQARFLCNGRNEVLVDHLFRYEAMPRLIGFLEDRLSTRIDLPRRNVSPEMAVDVSPGVRRLLERKRPREFAVWEAGLA